MQDDIDRILIPRERIARRIGELAQQIVSDHRAARSDDPGLVLVTVLSGALVFCADLMRQMPIDLRLRFLTVSSYPGTARESRGPELLTRPLDDLQGRDVLLLDDILDSGNTLNLLLPMLRSNQPASLRTCVLLRKIRPDAAEVPVDYVGFDIPDEFVVGYGLDYDNSYRNLPDIVTLKPQAIACRA